MIVSRVKEAAKHGIVGMIIGLNKRFSSSAGGENRPAFYNIDMTCPSLRLLDQNYLVIRDEMEGVLNYKDRIPRYHDLTWREQYISGTVNPDKNWRVFMLHSILGTPKANQEKCPRTTALVATNPNLYQAVLFDPRSMQVHSGPQRRISGLSTISFGLKSTQTKSSFHAGEGPIPHLGRRPKHPIGRQFEPRSLQQKRRSKSGPHRGLPSPMPFHLHAVNWAITRLLAPHGKEAKEMMANIKKYS